MLVHDTNQSHSLLAHLGLKDVLLFLDTLPLSPTPEPGTILLERWSAGLAAIELTGDGVRYIAPLDEPTAGDLSNKELAQFAEWWGRQVLKDIEGNPFTRRELRRPERLAEARECFSRAS